MSGAAGLDVRVPIGGMFTVIGIVIGGYGLATASDQARYVQSLSVNVNLWWGGVMLVFGLLLLVGAVRARLRG